MEELENKNCLLYKNLDLISKKWSIFILLKLSENPKKSLRYSQIKEVVPQITPRALSLRLKLLVENSILEKKETKINNQIISEYKLTKAGIEILPIIKSLRDWGLKYETCKPKQTCTRCDFL